MRLLLSVTLIAILVLTSAAVYAQQAWERGDAHTVRVGVVAPDAETAGEVVEAVEERGWFAVVLVPADKQQSNPEPPELEKIYEKGRDRLFHQSPDRALEYLQPRVEPKLEISRGWMAEGRNAEALFDAAMVLVRAHVELGDDERARRTMQRVVDALPAHRPDERMVPPDVVELWQQALDKLAEAGASADVSSLHRRSGCEPTVNGAVVKEDTVALPPDRSVVVGEHCDGKEQAVSRWVSVDAGEEHPVLAVGATTEKHQLGESFEVWGPRADLDVLVYLGPGQCEEDHHIHCLGLVAEEGDVEFEAVEPERLRELVGPMLKRFARRRTGSATRRRRWQTR